MTRFAAQVGQQVHDRTQRTYTPLTLPNNMFPLTDSFTYVLDDGHGGIAPGVVNVTVSPANAGSLNIVSITLESGGTRIKAQGIPGLSYKVQSSDDLQGRGIGRSIGLRLGSMGAVVLVGRAESDLRSAAGQIRANGNPRAEVCVGDVADPATAARSKPER